MGTGSTFIDVGTSLYTVASVTSLTGASVSTRLVGANSESGHTRVRKTLVYI